MRRDLNGDWTGLAVDVEAFDDKAFADAAIDKLGQGLVELLELQLPHGSAFRFEPQGTSLVRYGHHGRIAIHTWPERNVATIDLWMRRDQIDRAREALEPFLLKHHRARVTAMQTVGRA